MDELEERVFKFNTLTLPGQPMGMHMGTSYLVNDLWREVKRLRGLTPRALDFAICAPEYHASLDEAGDRFCRMCGQPLSQ